jgi:hypothetical protein
MKQEIPVDSDERVSRPPLPKTERELLVEQIVALQRQIYLLERKLNEMDQKEVAYFHRPPSR